MMKRLQQQIEDNPSIDEHQPVSRQHEEEYHRHYPAEQGAAQAVDRAGPCRITRSLSSGMIKERIETIKSTIEAAPNIPPAEKAELLKLVAGLKSELSGLAETHREKAASITRFADASAHEAARTEKNSQLAETALHGLRLSIQGLEESHPVMAGTVSRFATALSNMGL